MNALMRLALKLDLGPLWRIHHLHGLVNRRAGNDQKLVAPGTEPGLCLSQCLDLTQRRVGSSLWEI